MPSGGGLFGVLWDSDRGVLLLWFDGEYVGCPFHDDFSLKGKSVRFCVGIFGEEEFNRTIGMGMKSCVLRLPSSLPSFPSANIVL